MPERLEAERYRSIRDLGFAWPLGTLAVTLKLHPYTDPFPSGEVSRAARENYREEKEHRNA